MRMFISNEFSGDADAAKEQFIEYHSKIMIFSEMQALKMLLPIQNSLSEVL